MLWGQIWSEFSVNRERDRTGAYLTLLQALAAHGDAFVPVLIQPKDYADLVIHIESFIKQDVGTKQGSPIEALQRFLATGDVTADSAPTQVPLERVN